MFVRRENEGQEFWHRGEVCVRACVCIQYALTHLDGVWNSPPCQGYICGRVVQVGSLRILEGAAGGEREREREGGWAADA